MAVNLARDSKVQQMEERILREREENRRKLRVIREYLESIKTLKRRMMV